MRVLVLHIWQVLMRVLATGTAPLHYQWLFGFDEEDLRQRPKKVGGSYNTFKIMQVEQEHVGVYACVVSNKGSKVRSEPLELELLQQAHWLDLD